MTTVRGEGVDLHVQDLGGDGRPVVLLHGVGRDLTDWDDVSLGLQALGYRAVALDLRGHGGTPQAPWSWDLAVADVRAVTAALALRRPAVVGHGVGGMVAAHWAAAEPACPLAVDLDGHTWPTRPEQLPGLAGAQARQALDALASWLPRWRVPDSEHLRAVARVVAGTDLPAVHRAACCPLLLTRGEESLAELFPADLQPAWLAWEGWAWRELRAAAAVNPLVAVTGTPTALMPHVEAPELVVNLLDGALVGTATA